MVGSVVLTVGRLELDSEALLNHGFHSYLGVVSAVVVEHQVDGQVGVLGQHCLAHHLYELDELHGVGRVSNEVHWFS